ncbi:MAG TPA: hypothetical protein VEI95_06415 [Acidobacteriota bacterium]|nr:hypothetical protein [Acidobacteriota bacterium]
MYETLSRKFSSYATWVLTKQNSLLESESLIILALSIIALSLAVITATIARKKDGSYFRWFVAGAFFGIIALPMVIHKKRSVIDPPPLKQCPKCAEQHPLSTLICESCDYNFLSGMVGHRHKLLPHYETLSHEAPSRRLAYSG